MDIKVKARKKVILGERHSPPTLEISADAVLQSKESVYVSRLEGNFGHRLLLPQGKLCFNNELTRKLSHTRQKMENL